MSKRSTATRPLDPATLVQGVRAGSRAETARVITLLESTRPDHQALARQVLADLLPRSGGAIRVGVTGVPGVGKSTFVDALGSRLIEQGHRVAVLAVDPSSSRTGGSVLGDRTRMRRLAADPAAFVRPSPTAGGLGGVARATREAILVVEAAGYDVVLVETVGVGQSETAVAAMVDTFLVLAIARTGDQLQGIKKGVLECADIIAVNKADGPHERDARAAARELAGALRMARAPGPWTAPVLTCSAQEDSGIDEVWAAVLRHRATLETAGGLRSRRSEQQVTWLWALAEDRLVSSLRSHPGVRGLAAEIEHRVRDGSLPATTAADLLLEAFRGVGARPGASAQADNPRLT